MLHEKTILLI